jgi:shikimate kinase
MKDKTCLFLVGMPGCGKSTLGRLYAQHTGYTFVDMDEAIVSGTGKTIEQIYAEGGEKLFRDIEHEYIKRYFDQSNSVICTGGGLPCFNGNMELMNKEGITVFIDVSAEELWNRVKNTNFSGRPIYQNQTIDQVLETIKKKSAERRPVYETADIILKSDAVTLDMLLEGMKKFI